MHLVLVVSDCPRPPQPGDWGERAATPPPFPRLSSLLVRGRRAPTPLAWQRRLLAASADASIAGRSPAAIAAAATTAAAASGAWFAQPVHLQAAADHVRLPVTGLLRLGADDVAELRSDFERVFGGDGLALHALGDGGLLLSGLAAKAAAPEASRVAGGRVEAASSSIDARVRRLTGELELWLHEHAVNRRRERRGLASVSALWIWGGEPAAPGADGGGLPPLTRFQGWYGTDPFLAALAGLSGHALEHPGASLGDLAPRTSDATLLVQLSVRADEQGVDALAAIEERWLGPAWHALRRARLRRLHLLMLDECVELTPADSWRWWRHRRPWWETLQR